MGYNTTVLILNDAMSVIEEDPAGWWRKVREASVEAMKGKPVTFGHKGYANHFTVITDYHADETALIAVGGNYATVLHRTYTGRGHHEQEQQLALLKAAALERGYTLVRKRRPNGKVRR